METGIPKSTEIKMRLLLTYLSLVFLSGVTYGQEWRDSLDLARSAYKKGEYQKALKYYESAQKKAPDEVDLSDEIGQSAYKTRDFERAEKVYQQNTSNKKTAESKAKNLHNLGNARMKKKDYSGAIDAYKEALKNDPNNRETKYNLSESIRKQKEQQKQQQQNH